MFTRLCLFFKKLLAHCNKDADSKVIHQINFNWNLEPDGNTQMLFIIEEAKETVLDFSKEIIKVIRFYFGLI